MHINIFKFNNNANNSKNSNNNLINVSLSNLRSTQFLNKYAFKLPSLIRYCVFVLFWMLRSISRSRIMKKELPFINHQIKSFITRFLIKLSPTRIIYWSPNQRKNHQIELLATKSLWNAKLLNQFSTLNLATNERKQVFEAIKWNWNA